jgi:subtilase family serine protease
MHRHGTVGQPTAPCSHYYGQHQLPGLPEQFGRTSFPTYICGYSAGQVRAAYGANMHNTGRGQTVSVVELGLAPDMFLTLQDYAQADNFVAPSPQRYSELSLGANTCGDPFFLEEQVDVEGSYDMAPGANQLVVGGDSCDNGDFGFQGLFDADIVTIDGTAGSHHHPLANISSNSWGPGKDTQPAILTNIMHAYLVRAAAQGVGMYFASGDAPGVETPDDPFAILVGGTSLGIGKHGQRLFETGWSTGLSNIRNGKWFLTHQGGGTSGGPSLIWAQPPYQRGVVPRALAKAPGNRPGLVRSEPDIAAVADSFTGFAAGVLMFPKHKPPKFVEVLIGGTSLASPIVAGIVADAQQGQHKAFGFTDPVLYRLNGTPALNDMLPVTSRTPGLFRADACDAQTCRKAFLFTFDDQNPTMRGYKGQVTLKGYDNMSGIGTPRGQVFINALRKLEG